MDERGKAESFVRCSLSMRIIFALDENQKKEIYEQKINEKKKQYKHTHTHTRSCSSCGGNIQRAQTHTNGCK